MTTLDTTVADSPKELVIIVHGIRDTGSWRDKVATAIGIPGKLTTALVRYGYFNAFFFWFPFFTRNWAVNEVEQRVKELIALHQGKRISFIAHSFGTHIVAHLIKRNPNINVHRIIFCGSVLSRSYNWFSIERQITGVSVDGEKMVINDCGTKDIMPVIAYLVTFGFGDAGRNGIGGYVTDRFFDSGHSGYFEDKFLNEYWKPVFHEDRIAKSGGNKPAGLVTNLLLGLSFIIKPALYLIPIALLVLLIYIGGDGVVYTYKKMTAKELPPIAMDAASSGTSYIERFVSDDEPGASILLGYNANRREENKAKPSNNFVYRIDIKESFAACRLQLTSYESFDSVVKVDCSAVLLRDQTIHELKTESSKKPVVIVDRDLMPGDSILIFYSAVGKKEAPEIIKPLRFQVKSIPRN